MFKGLGLRALRYVPTGKVIRFWFNFTGTWNFKKGLQMRILIHYLFAIVVLTIYGGQV